MSRRRWDRPPRDAFDPCHILALLQQGKREQAWEPLWLEYAEPFSRFASTYYILEKGPEDCVSDFFLQIMQRDAEAWKTIKEPQRLHWYLWTAFKNSMNGAYRKKQWEIPESQLSRVNSPNVSSLPDFPAPLPDDDELEPYCVDCIRRAWQVFCEKYPMARDMIERIVIEGWSHKALSAYIEETYHQTRDRRHYHYWLNKCRTDIHDHVQKCCGECLP